MTGVPIILLHGCGGSPEAAFVSTGWVDALEATGRQVIAMDLPGHGPTKCSHDPKAYADMVGLLTARLPAGPFDAIGFSLGSKLLLGVALREPERIRRLVLGGIGDNVFAPEAIGEAAASALELGPSHDTPPPVLRFLETWEPHRNDGLAVAAVLRRPPNPVFSDDQLASIELPILLVNGSADPVGQNTIRLDRALKVARRLTLPEVSHFGLTAQPLFIHAALSFLNESGEDRAPTREISA